jgi:hypothetical protein
VPIFLDPIEQTYLSARILTISSPTAIEHLDSDSLYVAAENVRNRLVCGELVGGLRNRAANLKMERPWFLSPSRLTYREMSVVYEFEERSDCALPNNLSSCSAAVENRTINQE